MKPIFGVTTALLAGNSFAKPYSVNSTYPWQDTLTSNRKSTEMNSHSLLRGNMASQSATEKGIENAGEGTWVLYSDYGSDAYCGEDGVCFDVLAPSAQQWINIYDGGWKGLQYMVCETSGDASVIYNDPISCAVWSGTTVQLKADYNGVTVEYVQEGTSPKNPPHQGSLYSVTVTPEAESTCTFLPPTVYADGKMRIVNLAGAEFNSYPKFPHECDLDYFAQAGVNTVRFPFLWEYIQPNLGLPIDWSEGGYAAQLKLLIDAWTSKGFTVLVDMHNYMKYSHTVIGAPGSWVSEEQYASAWKQIAEQIKDNPLVQFNLMNEPMIDGGVDYDGTQLTLDNQNAADQAIRETGATQKSLYSGNGYSNVADWSLDYYGTPNSEVFVPERIISPNYAVDAHWYYAGSEQNYSPENGCVTPRSECIDKQNPEDFLNWQKTTRISVVFGETSGTDSEDCINCILDGTKWLMNQTQWDGIGLWAGGHAWLSSDETTSYSLYLAPEKNVEQSQMADGFKVVDGFLEQPPTPAPSKKPTVQPSTAHPSFRPTDKPTSKPTTPKPTSPTGMPTGMPTRTEKPADEPISSTVWIGVATGSVALGCLVALACCYKDRLKACCSSVNRFGLFGDSSTRGSGGLSLHILPEGTTSASPQVQESCCNIM